MTFERKKTGARLIAKAKKVAATVAITAAAFTVAFSVAATAATKGGFDAAYADAAFTLTARAVKDGKNCLVSPTSALVATNMVEIGATGATKKEMETVFGGLSTKATTTGLSKMTKRLSKSKAATFKAARSAWYRKGKVKIKKSYVDAVSKAHGATSRAVAFDSSTVKAVNDWASEATNGKIRSVVDRFEPSDLFVLVDATYFKGEWVEPYAGSKKRAFKKADGSTKKAPTLEGTENQYFTVGGAKCFAKPYVGGTFSFVGILPPKGTSPKAFLKKTKGSDFLKAYRGRTTSGVVVRTRIPKVKSEFETSLKPALKKLGMKKAFTNAATFGAMTKTKVRVDDVVHKTFVSIDEKGTEATAVTAVMMKAASVLPMTKPKVKTVYLNRPFAYAIVETKTGLPVFIGTVCDP